jgi:hypothetical protein
MSGCDIYNVIVTSVKKLIFLTIVKLKLWSIQKNAYYCRNLANYFIFYSVKLYKCVLHFTESHMTLNRHLLIFFFMFEHTFLWRRVYKTNFYLLFIWESTSWVKLQVASVTTWSARQRFNWNCSGQHEVNKCELSHVKIFLPLFS